MAISLRLNTRRRTTIATATRLPRYARNDKPQHRPPGEGWGGELTGVGMGFLRWDMASNLQVELGFRPGFGQQPDAAPEAALEQQAPEPVDAVADHADGARRTATGVTVIGSQRFGRCPQAAWQSSDPGRLPLWFRRPGPAAWPPTAPASGGRRGPGRCGGSGPISSPGS